MKKTKLKLAVLASVALAAMLSGCAGSEQETSKEVNVYSARHYEVDKQAYLDFEKETGIKVNIIEGKAPELLERMKREGADTQADLFITADMGNIYQAIDGDMTQALTSKILMDNIPENLRGENDEWVALTKRARVIVYDKEKVNPNSLSTYAALTDNEWKGKLLVRGADSVYNQSLLASFIAAEGEEYAKMWAQGIIDNLARDPKGNDRDQVKAIAAGEGLVTLVNTYYLGQMLNSSDPEEVKAAQKVGIFFPENTHVNISGMVLSKYSANKANAVLLAEYLTSDKVQKAYTEENYEYPANKNVEPSELLKTWGELKPQDLDLSDLGRNNKKAVELFARAAWK
jgi:iron(III) transport system substrate-binding protein